MHVHRSAAGRSAASTRKTTWSSSDRDRVSVRFVVLARSHAEAVRHALAVLDRLLAVLPGPSSGARGIAYVPVGFDTIGLRPVDGPSSFRRSG
jgi:hypothetical protein